MLVSRLASESDIQGTDILITGAATLTDTGTTGRTMVTTVGRRSIGITDTECTIRVGIIATIATGGKINGEKFSQAGGFNIPPAYFFGDVEAAGADGDVIDGGS
jgi:hypothetical protein